MNSYFKSLKKKGMIADIVPGEPTRDPAKKKSGLSKFLKFSGIIFGIAILFGAGFYTVRIISFKKIAEESAEQIYLKLDGARKELQALNPAGAKESFVAVNEQIQGVEAEASRYGLLSFAQLFGNVSGKIAAIPGAIKNLTILSAAAVQISGDVIELKDNLFSYIVNQKGKELISMLQSLHGKTLAVNQTLSELKSQSKQIGGVNPGDLLSIEVELYKSEKLLKALIDFLDNPIERHLILGFINPSEIRPAGGFIGSYAEIGLQRGNLTNITIRDIYDPDGQLALKVIPPKTLQIITPHWGARDANWFFDFPTSAQKILYFLNNSKIYSEKLVNFDGIIALNVDVMEDIFKVIGPIELPEYKLVLTEENFLKEVQREVESGIDKKAGEPKKILKVLTPKLFERLAALLPSERQEMFQKIRDRVKTKDVMFYLNDLVIETYLQNLGVGGEVYKSEDKIAQDYLAVVNANIAGGKSDAFIVQTINLASAIDADGKISSKLEITRKHSGQNEKEWWYKAINKDYVQIYTPRGSKITSIVGRDKWPTIPKWDYASSVVDSDVRAIEDSTIFRDKLGVDQVIAFGKTAFAFWLNTPAGEKKTLTMEYENPDKIRFANGNDIPFRFVFDKQSGVNTNFSYTIEAPVNYKWKESNSGTFGYASSNPDGQIILNLTLTPIE